MNRTLTLFIDGERRMLVGGLDSPSPATLPDLMQGDTVDVVLQGVEKQDSVALQYYLPVPISFTTIKCAITVGADVPPTDGTIRLGLVGGAAEDVTPPFPPGITKPDLAALLNALPGVIAKGGVKVLTTNAATNIFRVRWNSPTETAEFEFRENLLEPPSDVRTNAVLLPNGQMQLLKYRQLPLAFTDQFALPVAPVVTVASVRTGTSARNCIQSITVPRNALGSVHFTFAGSATTILPVTTLTTSAVSDALNNLYSDGVDRFSVTQATSTVLYVEFVGPLALADFPVLGAVMHDQVPIQTPTARLPLNGPTLEMAFDGTSKISRLLEIEITDADGEVGTPIQVPVNLRNDVIDGGMALGANPDWLKQIDPTYQPYDPDGAAIVGYRSYIIALGTGVANGATSGSFVVTHNLGTQDCHVTVRETGGTRHRIPDVQYVCTFVNDDQIQIDFAGVPGYTWDALPLSGQFEVVISSAVSAELALPHHTHPITDIDGLEEELEALTAGISPDAPIPANRLPNKIPWYIYDANGKPIGFRFDMVPDGLLSDNIARLVNGRLPSDELPLGVPHLDGNGNLVVDLPGPPPSTLVLLDSTGHFPGGLLPTDPTSWPGFEDAILAVLQAGAPTPKGFIPITIAPVSLNLPADVKLRPDAAAVPATLPRALPAFTATGPVTGALPMPGPGLSNTVVTIGGAGASAAAVRYRAPQLFDPGAVVGCDGLQYFPVFLDGGNAYPTEMEIELFTVHVAPNMLVSGSRFLCNATVQLGLSGPCAASTRAAYFLRVRFGRTNGPLLSTVSWDSDAILQQLVVSSATVAHNFGVSVTKAATSGARTATMSFYGRETTVVAPPSDDFVVKATLTKFDLEDVPGLNVGQINVKMPTALASIALLAS